MLGKLVGGRKESYHLLMAIFGSSRWLAGCAVLVLCCAHQRKAAVSNPKIDDSWVPRVAVELTFTPSSVQAKHARVVRVPQQPTSAILSELQVQAKQGERVVWQASLNDPLSTDTGRLTQATRVLLLPIVSPLRLEVQPTQTQPLLPRVSIHLTEQVRAACAELNPPEAAQECDAVLHPVLFSEAISP